jgi:hypothetical protein
MQPGDTFLMPCPGYSPRESHLWIVISDPAKHGGIFIIVNVTKNANRAGNECELNKGDHQWVNQKCFVNFGDALEISVAQAKNISQLMASKTVTTHDPLDEKVFQRIIVAAKQSVALEPEYKKYL